ncbi:MAG: TetR/AcrR family transcriptional regulator [Plesiomonas shigelloides]|uniref:TetR/AcrR family transcriptional regulator n=1 Tax=Plesiomonas shigelloides TaxID=703 RepID=UPI001E5295AB|nr:TetR/AcrR family transcriptional regulator [Plesiomonas shigelloides]
MRSAEFDRDAVLVQAMETFRAHGYSKTTMQQLVAATGLHPGSIYAAFGNKRGLFLAAIEHYVAERSRFRQQMLTADPSPLAALHHYLNLVAGEMVQGVCLVTRSLLELGEDADLRAQLALIYHHMEHDFRALLLRAQKLGEVPLERDIEVLTLYLMTGIQGLVTVAKCHPERETLHAVVAQLMGGLQAMPYVGAQVVLNASQ